MLHVTWMTLSMGSILPLSVFTQNSCFYYYFSGSFFLLCHPHVRMPCLLVYFPRHQFFAFGQKKKNKQPKTTDKHCRCQQQILRRYLSIYINGSAKRRRNSYEMSTHLHRLNRWRRTDIPTHSSQAQQTHQIHYTNKIESRITTSRGH